MFWFPRSLFFCPLYFLLIHFEPIAAYVAIPRSPMDTTDRMNAGGDPPDRPGLMDAQRSPEFLDDFWGMNDYYYSQYGMHEVGTLRDPAYNVMAPPYYPYPNMMAPPYYLYPNTMTVPYYPYSDMMAPSYYYPNSTMMPMHYYPNSNMMSRYNNSYVNHYYDYPSMMYYDYNMRYYRPNYPR